MKHSMIPCDTNGSHMQRITREKLTPVFDRRSAPVAHVSPGEVFLVETEDSRGGRTRVPEHTTPEYLLAMRKQGYHGNPVTGPVFVESAEPGDTLAVHILSRTRGRSHSLGEHGAPLRQCGRAGDCSRFHDLSSGVCRGRAA